MADKETKKAMQISEEKTPRKSSVSGIVITVIVVAAVFGLMAIIGSNSSNNAETSTTIPEPPATQPIPVTRTPSVPIENSIPSQSQQPAPAQPAPPTASLVPKSWHTITTFSGSGKQNTSPFTVQGAEWKVDWTATVPEGCGGDGCDMYIGIHNTAGGVGDYVMTPNLTANSSGSSYEYDGPGTFYFTVDPGAISAWRVSVEDYY